MELGRDVSLIGNPASSRRGAQSHHSRFNVEQVAQIVDKLQVPLHPGRVVLGVDIANRRGQVAVQQSVVLLGDQTDLDGGGWGGEGALRL